MAARESLPRRGHWNPIQPCRDGGALQGEGLGTHQEKWGGRGPVCQGLCSGETSKEASVQVGLTMAGTWVAEWRGRPAQHPFHPLLQPRTLSSERAGRWCFLRRYLGQELPVQPPETTQLAVSKSWRLCHRGDQRRWSRAQRGS